VSQLTLYNAASRAQPQRGESFVGWRMSGDDAGQVPSAGGRPGGTKRTPPLGRANGMLRRGPNGTPGQGTRPTVSPPPPRTASPCGHFQENRTPRSFQNALNRLQPRPLGTAAVPVAPAGVSPTSSPFRFLPPSPPSAELRRTGRLPPWTFSPESATRNLQSSIGRLPNPQAAICNPRLAAPVPLSEFMSFGSPPPGLGTGEGLEVLI